ncbi:MAG TPA: NAD(P)H-dependent oxidoreductase subunit E, partial [Acidobacteriaceae bacterium]|nr:NAD(P)H-dependent oxidoreductase subunit E [Acidobacteriaceae bacterium]
MDDAMNADELQQIASAAVEEREQFEYQVNVCMGTGCLSQHSDKVKAAIEKEAEGCGKKCHVRRTGCMGLCAAGPMVLIEPSETRYGHVREGDAKEIVATLGAEPLARLDPHLGGYFEGQHHVVLENSGHIDPEKVEEYVARGGYEALVKALTDMNPSSVIEQISKSGLRGRGGGGYPTGLKWDTVAKVKGAQKYVICNGDEGDPGAFMDRSVLESDPQRVIEGMAIAAYAIGANKGYIYVRAEYPLAVQRLNVALQQARRRGFLGNGICDTTFSFDIDIRLGAGAFVCG